MHVLVVPRGLYDVPRVPIAGVFERQQAAALNAAGIRVGVVSGGVITARHLGRRFPYRRTDVVDEITVHRSYRRTYLPARWETATRAAERSYRALRPLLEAYLRDHGEPDVVHAHNLEAGGLLARRIREDFGFPYVVTEHTGTYAASVDAAVRAGPVLALGAQEASAIIAVGSRLAGNLRTALGVEYSTRILLVPNVVDPELLSRPIAPRQSPFVVAALGNLVASKNYALLIRAFQRAALPTDAQLVIGGRGGEARRLRSLVSELGLNGRVQLPGYLDRTEVAAHLQRASLFAHPSDHESFGVVLIEALAVGLPVVATASGGPEDIVTPDVGRLVPVGALDRFAEALSDMFEHRADFDPTTVREACRARFGPAAFADRMLPIYQRAIS